MKSHRFFFRNGKLKAYKIARILLPFICLPAFAQHTAVIDSSMPGYRTVIAGPEYGAGKFYRFLWGNQYRKEWTTPVRVPVINLDTVAGGLTALLQGGGRQTKTLRLQNAAGKQFVLRTINKDYSALLPEIVHGTFIQKITRDVTSTGHPYASVTVPGMIQAAGVFHTRPQIVFVPYTPSLGKFNETFANTLCLFEERADENQENTPNFGFAKDVKGTDSMMAKIRRDNEKQVDQKAYVRARLFDMFLGDWGRHEDQWRWAEFDSGEYRSYKPIPRDRDQVFTRFDGFLLKKIIGTGETDHIQSFGHHIRDIRTYNFPARHLDRRFANAMTKKAWTDIAKELQDSITDSIIQESIHRLPPEVFPISGNEIISKLQSRRRDLVDYAAGYYDFIAKTVDVIGSEKNEQFYIRHLGPKELQVEVFDLDKKGRPKSIPFYSRTFHKSETEEIRIYGIAGNDIFTVSGDGRSDIEIRIIGGPQKDSMINLSATAPRPIFYDNRDNYIAGKVRKKLSNDTSVHSYRYNWFRYNEGDLVLSPYYSNIRGIHFNAGYDATKHGFRKDPYSWRQILKGYYSISNNSFGGDYIAVFTDVIRKWDVLLNASYDQRLQYYFFGLGNESKFAVPDKFYYQWFSEEFIGRAGMDRVFGLHHTIGFSGYYQMVQVEKEAKTYLGDFFSNGTFETKTYAGVQLNYRYHNYNDEIIPTKGLEFQASGEHIRRLKESSRNVNRFETMLGFYLPISKVVSIASRTGASTLTGSPEFFQMNTLGGGRTLRGYIRQRFFGETAVYNGTELRFFFNVRSYLMNGKIGLIGFVDNGRVWLPGENSNTIHTGYGGGLMIAPFNKISVTVYYGISEEGGRIHFRLGRLF